MTSAARRIALVGLVLALAIAWFARLAPPTGVGPTEPLGLPALPAWQATDAGTPQALPPEPDPPMIQAFIADARERFAGTLPHRWRLALIEGRLLGPDGALALVRGSGLPVTDPARLEVLRAVAAEVTARARHNDFTAAEMLLDALLPEETQGDALGQARALLTERQARWQQDPARASRIAGAAAAAAAGIAAGSPASLANALGAVRRIDAEDPDHGAAATLRAEITRRALAAWTVALETGDWPALEQWSAWAAHHLPEIERRDLAAATRAALERLHARPPASMGTPNTDAD